MTYYEVLSVAPTATQDQLKQARRNAAQLYHPDRLQQLPESVRALAEEQFKRINAAYDVLSDPVQRSAYDAALRAATPSIPATPAHPAYPTSGTPDAAGTASGTSPAPSERHARAWAILLGKQRQRRRRFWISMVCSSLALLAALVVALLSVATKWLPSPNNLPQPVWLGVLGVVAQLVALSSVARVAHVVIGPRDVMRFGAAMLMPVLGTWMLVGVVFVLVLVTSSSTAALRVVFILPLTAHLLLCLWWVRRAVTKRDLAEQQRLLWHPR